MDAIASVAHPILLRLDANIMDHCMISNFLVNLSQVELQYLHDYAGISTSIGLTANPIVNFSGTIGTNVVALGTDLSFDTKSGNFTKCNAGVSFCNADLIASLTVWVNASYKVAFAFLFPLFQMLPSFLVDRNVKAFSLGWRARVTFHFSHVSLDLKKCASSLLSYLFEIYFTRDDTMMR